MRRERRTDGAALDLIPMMNLVAILIPFLLIASQFVGLAVVQTSLPGGGGEESDLALRVAVTRQGWFVGGADQVLGPADSPRGHAVTTVEDLQGLLGQVKRAHPEARGVVLEPDADVDYAALIAAMDATRTSSEWGELFPDVLVAGGAP